MARRGAATPTTGAGIGASSTTVTTKPIDPSRSLTRARKDLGTRGLTPALVARPGERGPAVWVLREALVARGLLPAGSPTRDHPYDPETVGIVRAFQQERSLEVDGIVGPITWGALLGAIEPDENSPMVMVLKAVLIVRGLIRDNAANLATDYGPITQQRVRDFQALSGIEAIARVGPQTWTALLGVKRRLDLSGRGDEVDEVDEQVEIDGEAVEDFDDVDLDDLDLLGLLDEVPAT
ncbi:MAG: peptidoglycan-binding protein [Ilumatobacteraceae bacterium]